jgi:hypothetical protein
VNSTNNDSLRIAVTKVFSDLFALINEDEKEIEHNKHKMNIMNTKGNRP